MKPHQLPQLTKKQWAGFICIYLAGLGWLVDIIVPFTPIHNKHLVFAIALGFAESMFLLGLAFLGRAYYHQVRNTLIEFIQNKKNRP